MQNKNAFTASSASFFRCGGFSLASFQPNLYPVHIFIPIKRISTTVHRSNPLAVMERLLMFGKGYGSMTKNKQRKKRIWIALACLVFSIAFFSSGIYKYRYHINSVNINEYYQQPTINTPWRSMLFGAICLFMAVMALVSRNKPEDRNIFSLSRKERRKKKWE